MLFHKPQKRVTIPTLEIDNIQLNSVDEFNFLGLFLDKHMTWNKHIQTITSKISQISGIMNKLKYVLPTNVLIMLYNSLITPRLNYCLLAWGHHFDRIFVVQKRQYEF